LAFALLDLFALFALFDAGGADFNVRVPKSRNARATPLLLSISKRARFQRAAPPLSCVFLRKTPKRSPPSRPLFNAFSLFFANDKVAARTFAFIFKY
jgi:hypothetical protein